MQKKTLSNKVQDLFMSGKTFQTVYGLRLRAVSDAIRNEPKGDKAFINMLRIVRAYKLKIYKDIDIVESMEKEIMASLGITPLKDEN